MKKEITQGILFLFIFALLLATISFCSVVFGQDLASNYKSTSKMDINTPYTSIPNEKTIDYVNGMLFVEVTYCKVANVTIIDWSNVYVEEIDGFTTNLEDGILLVKIDIPYKQFRLWSRQVDNNIYIFVARVQKDMSMEIEPGEKSLFDTENMHHLLINN